MPIEKISANKLTQAALDLAESQYKAAKAGRDSVGAATEQAKLTQSFSKISAPYDAWVLETYAQTGDLAMPGKALITVFAPQPLRVVMQWPASDQLRQRHQLTVGSTHGHGQHIFQTNLRLNRTLHPHLCGHFYLGLTCFGDRGQSAVCQRMVFGIHSLCWRQFVSVWFYQCLSHGLDVAKIGRA